MKEKIKGKTLILKVFENQNSNEPFSCSEIFFEAEALGLSNSYSKGSTDEQKKAQLGATLLTWTQLDKNCPLIRHEKGYDGYSSITYELNKKFKNKSQLDNIHKTFNEIRENFKESRPIITTQLRHKLWSNFWNNSMNGLCIVCGAPITITDFVCGHIEAWSVNKNNDISNLAPVCNLCNKSMGTMDMREYKKKYHSNIDIPCKINIFLGYITKEDVIQCLEEHIDKNPIDAVYFQKAIELLNEH